MESAPTEDPQAAAIEQLERFGLSGYAAQTFVALASLGSGTARDVSQVSDVPRTRVYDAIDELHERGLVDGEDASPSDPRSETAIWGEGETNSLVVVLKAIFAWRLDTADPD